jgi:hypothetical protein
MVACFPSYKGIWPVVFPSLEICRISSSFHICQPFFFSLESVCLFPSPRICLPNVCLPMSLSKDLSAYAPLFESVCPHPSHDFVCLSLCLFVCLSSLIVFHPMGSVSFGPSLNLHGFFPTRSVCLHVSISLSRD